MDEYTTLVSNRFAELVKKYIHFKKLKSINGEPNFELKIELAVVWVCDVMLCFCGIERVNY
jgi:hypothetical protein